jgi:hypothetical protein
VNGGFDINNNGLVIPGGGYATLNVGDTWLEGWTVGGPGHNIFVIGGTRFGAGPYDGYQWIDFNGLKSPPGGTLAQTFTTTVGQPYTVTFHVGEFDTGDESVTAMAFGSNNALLASNYCVPKVGFNGSWFPFQLNFTAVSTNTTLLFLDSSKETDSGDSTLDGVAVMAAPRTGGPVVAGLNGLLLWGMLAAALVVVLTIVSVLLSKTRRPAG